MDLTHVTDIDKLKSLGFDQIAAIELAQKNLQVINTRIAQINDTPKDKAGESVAKNPAGAPEVDKA